MKWVKYTGTRVPRMRVHVVVNGQQFNSRGYIMGKDSVVQLSDAEADVLTGVTPPVVTEAGKITTGFYIDGQLGEAGLAGEAWEEIADPTTVALPGEDLPVPEISDVDQAKNAAGKARLEANKAQASATSAQEFAKQAESSASRAEASGGNGLRRSKVQPVVQHVAESVQPVAESS